MQESKSCALPLGDGPSSYTDKTLNIFPIFFHLIKNPCHKQGYKRWIEGFEPSASRATIWRANQLRYTHHINVLGGIRTPDPRLRRPLLYPTELQTHSSALTAPTRYILSQSYHKCKHFFQIFLIFFKLIFRAFFMPFLNGSF